MRLTVCYEGKVHEFEILRFSRISRFFAFLRRKITKKTRFLAIFRQKFDPFFGQKNGLKKSTFFIQFWQG